MAPGKRLLTQRAVPVASAWDTICNGTVPIRIHRGPNKTVRLTGNRLIYNLCKNNSMFRSQSFRSHRRFYGLSLAKARKECRMRSRRTRKTGLPSLLLHRSTLMERSKTHEERTPFLPFSQNSSSLNKV